MSLNSPSQTSITGELLSFRRTRRTAKTLDDYIAEFNSALKELPDDPDALDKLAAHGPATTVPPFVELGRSPSPSEYCALHRLLLEDHAMEDFYFTPVDALLADFHKGVDPHVSFNELVRLWG